ncbi:hypothetical protein GCM10023238_23730 [Streptomyces heliomycini]
METICLGQAEGAAALLLLAAGAPGKRMLLPGSRLVLRQPSLPGAGGGTDQRSGDPGRGVVLRVRSRMEEILVRHTGPQRGAGLGGHRAGHGPRRAGGGGVRAGGPIVPDRTERVSPASGAR